jgi:hypothetical protein
MKKSLMSYQRYTKEEKTWLNEYVPGNTIRTILFMASQHETLRERSPEAIMAIVYTWFSDEYARTNVVWTDKRKARVIPATNSLREIHAACDFDPIAKFPGFTQINRMSYSISRLRKD